MSDLLISVKQISNYPALTAADGSETLLVQRFGLGGPYASISARLLVSTALNQSGPLGVGRVPPVDAYGAQVFANQVIVPPDGDLLFNAYYDRQSLLRFWQPGGAAALRWDAAQGLGFLLGPSGPGGSPVGQLTPLLTLSPAGNMVLPRGTLRVARDPAAADEVVTLRHLLANTVASLNGRRGAVRLTAEDVYRALDPGSPLATQQDILDKIQEFAAGYPLVTAWNGRVGSVWLQLADVMSTFFEPGARPIAPTPPPTDASARIATTEWVANFAYQKLWLDILGTFAPINSPEFTGNPTAPEPELDDDSARLATTEWVKKFVEEISAGVTAFNGRSGFVQFLLSDLTAVTTAPGAVPVANTPLPTATGTEIATARWVNDNSQRLTHIATTAPTAFNTGDLWLNPTSRRLQVWTGTAWLNCGAPGITVSDTAPANPWQGDAWFDSSDGTFHMWYVQPGPPEQGQWVKLGGGA